MRDIVLASASPRRSELLKQVGVKFSIMPADIDESIIEGLSPEEFVQKLAYEKAMSVAKKLDYEALVIGADTVVVKDEILGKPQSRDNGFQMIKSLQDCWHEVITGVAVIDSAGLKASKGFEKTRVKMRKLSDDFIRSYISTGEADDKAGAYGIQGMGALLVERIEGCYFNVVGLPLTRLSIMLEEFNVHLL